MFKNHNEVDFKGELQPLPTKAELEEKTLEELLKFRGEVEEKLNYLRKNNAADNEILQENEEYYRMIERLVKTRINLDKAGKE